MILHIVRSGETVRMIADNYQVEVSDITSNNLHITDFKSLKAGMKLKIPFLSKPVIETLEETESFISDYYPSLVENFNEPIVKKEKEIKEEIIEDLHAMEKQESIKEEIPRDVILEEKNERIPEVKPVEVTQPYRYSSGYSGNIIPKVPDIYIKKI